MDETTRERIGAVRSEVHKSDLEPEHKDALQRRLDHAAKCANGTPEKLNALATAVSDGIVHDVRMEIRQPERMRRIVSEAIEEHEQRSEQRLEKIVRETVASAIAEHLKKCRMRTEAGRSALGPVLSKLGAPGRAFAALPVEGRITAAIVLLWAVNRFGVENVITWLGGLFG